MQLNESRSDVQIDAAYLELLLSFAKAGDVAKSQRRLQHAFRKHPVCSDPGEREPDCFICQAFTAAEEALR